MICQQGRCPICNERCDTLDNVRRLFYKQGKQYHVGQLFKQPELANTLRKIHRYGDKGFYQGSVARAIVAENHLYGGNLSLADLRTYQTKWRRPIECTYHGFTIISAPPPSSGGVTICETLKIMAPFPLKKWGFLSAKSIHYNVEAMRMAYLDRNAMLGDPDHYKNTIKWLLSTQHINSLRAKILSNKACTSSKLSHAMPQEPMQTTHYSIVDKWGNAVSMTYSLNGYYYFVNGIRH